MFLKKKTGGAACSLLEFQLGSSKSYFIKYQQSLLYVLFVINDFCYPIAHVKVTCFTGKVRKISWKLVVIFITNIVPGMTLIFILLVN